MTVSTDWPKRMVLLQSEYYAELLYTCIHHMFLSHNLTFLFFFPGTFNILSCKIQIKSHDSVERFVCCFCAKPVLLINHWYSKYSSGTLFIHVAIYWDCRNIVPVWFKAYNMSWPCITFVCRSLCVGENIAGKDLVFWARFFCFQDFLIFLSLKLIKCWLLIG